MSSDKKPPGDESPEDPSERVSPQDFDVIGNESTYSMDSFVMDRDDEKEFVESGEDERKRQAASSDDEHARAYFSPASSTSVASVSDNLPAMATLSQAHPPQPPSKNPVTLPKKQTPLQETIERPHHRKQSSDGVMTINSESLQHMPPANPFFSPSFYEQDNASFSDGSVVFQQSPPPSTVHQQPTVQHKPKSQSRPGHNRERVASFDSVGSSGSVRYVPPRPQPTPSPQSTPATSSLASQQNINPRMLPYHERRKLMQQRRQQQQKQPPSSQQHHHQPHPPNQLGPVPDPQVMPYMMPQQAGQPPHFQQMPYPPEMAGYPPPMAPPGMMQPYPGQLPPYPMDQSMSQHPPPPLPMIGFYPPHPGYAPPSPQMQPAPPSMQVRQNPAAASRPPQPVAGDPNRGGGGGGRRGYQQYPTLQRAVSAPPRHHRSASSGGSSGGGSGHLQPSSRNTESRSLTQASSSSFDSSEGALVQEDGVDQTARPVRRRSKEYPPPAPLPPPPPPPQSAPPPIHVRQDSSGSVSSLGSMDRSGRDSEFDESRSRKSKGGKVGGFLQRLNPFGNKERTVEDFHRQNQAFLSRMDRQQQYQQQQGSPLTMLTKVASPRLQNARKGIPVGPPPSRGTHKRLPSIDNDDWDEDVEGAASNPKQSAAKTNRNLGSTNASSDEGISSALSSSGVSDVEDSERFNADDESEPDETTNLLPPSGISTNEYYDRTWTQQMRGNPGSGRNSSTSEVSSALHDRTTPASSSSSRRYLSNEFGDSTATTRIDNTTMSAILDYQREMDQEKRRHKKKKKRGKQHRSRAREVRWNEFDDSLSSSSDSSRDYHSWMTKRADLLEKERAKLIKQWREEARAEEEAARRARADNSWFRNLGRNMESEIQSLFQGSFRFFAWLEAFIANLPLTIGAIAMAIANLGVDWFKFAEENLESCEPVHFHSSQCSFPEFPGCFYCDTDARMYKLALRFHWACSALAGMIALTFVLKLLLARRVVFDELSSPTTASPAGLVCMCTDVVFAGHGFVGMAIVLTSSTIHLCLAIWFIYMALAYRIMPDPSWFPNTVAIGISAVKTWLYYPTAGHFLMAISLSLNFFFFPISLIRVALNRKISATVGWMQMSAPNISLYALTIMAQPSFEEEHPDVTEFQRVHRKIYMPCMHFLFALCLIGMAASISSLVVRWKEFRKLPFSPAHAAFCCPTLSHANAVQAYRAAVNSFSQFAPYSPFRICLYTYWVTVLVSGTIVTLVVATKFIWSLPEWTHINVEDEEEPPAPYETAMSLTNMISTGESMFQPFISPAILQANETGALVLTRDNTGVHYRRTRQVTSIGFEPMMDVIALEQEREILLDWVGKHPPRRRNRTLSVPGIDFSYGADIGTGTGVYGMPSPDSQSYTNVRRPRLNTASPNLSARRFRKK